MIALRHGGRARVATLVVAVAVLAIAVVLALADRADAGEFTIDSCAADRAGFSTRAFEDFATRGMRIRRACSPEGEGRRGLLAGNVVRGGRVPRGARAGVILAAPAGTQFVRFRWSGEARRRDCAYTLQLYAEGPGIAPVAIKNVRANRGCPRRGRAQAAGWPRPRTYAIPGATRIVQRVACVGSRGRRFCRAGGLNYLRTFKASATVADVSPPAVSVLATTPLARGEWVAGDQPLAYEASDNVGVRVARALLSGLRAQLHERPCSYSERAPCPNGPGGMTIDTAEHGDGTQELSIHVEDAAGNIGVSSPVVARVDNTAPGAAAVSVDSGQAWRRTNVFAARWVNAPEVDRAPLVAAHYRLCGPGGSCVTGSRTGEGIAAIPDLAVPGPGEWQLRVWRADAAGNALEANASAPVRLRYDPDPPAPVFDAISPLAPTRVSVSAPDRLSGLAGGRIELSAVGSGVWQALATSREHDRLVASIDDHALPPGMYALRAVAVDAAGNEASTDRRADGQPMHVQLPLRASASLRAGVVSQRVVRPRKRSSKRRAKPRRVTVLAPAVRLPLGREVTVSGRLTVGDGVPLPNATLSVLASSRATGEQRLGSVQTDGDGNFRYTAKAGSSQRLRFAFAGSATALPVDQAVDVLVPATTSIAVSRRRLLNGQSVVFSGKLRGLAPPAGSKLVELQVRVADRWQTFRTPHADAQGRWRVRYRFSSTSGVQTYRFRARLPAEASYPYETGRSRVTSVRVRGRPR